VGYGWGFVFVDVMKKKEDGIIRQVLDGFQTLSLMLSIHKWICAVIGLGVGDVVSFLFINVHLFFLCLFWFLLALTLVAILAIFVNRREVKRMLPKELAIEIWKKLSKLIEDVKNYQNISITIRQFETKRGAMPKEYNNLLKKLIEKMNRYNNLLKIAESLIHYGMWYISSCLRHNLEGEFEELKVGHLADELKECLKGPIIRGKDIRISWLEDTYPIFCENIKKCKHSLDLKEIPGDVKRFITANGEYLFKELEREINFIMCDANDFKEKLERDYKLGEEENE
jgi:hypothetical protein